MSERFPVSEYYGSDLVRGTTISKDDAWWSAVLLIREPCGETEFVMLYRWAKRNGAWERSGSCRFSTVEQVWDAIRVLDGYATRLGGGVLADV